MIEHLTQKQLEDYCLRQLPVGDLLAVSEHLGGCEACQQRIETGLKADASFFALKSNVFAVTEVSSAENAAAHLTADQISGYVDHTLAGDDLLFATDHLHNCEYCVLAVADIQAFSKEIAPSIEQEFHPAAIPGSTLSWWQRTTESLSSIFRVSPIPALAMAAAIVLLAVLGWLFVRRLQDQRPAQNIALVPTASPQPTSEPVASPTAAPKLEPEVVAQINDGKGLLSLDREGKLSGADDLPPSYQSLIKKALTTRQIEKSAQLEGLVRPASSLMSANKEKGEFAVIEPAGNVLLTDRPTFRWSPLEGATSYIVEVYDSNFKLVASSPSLTDRSWASPALARGKVYAWQVKANKEGQEVTAPRPPAPQAKFRVLDQAKANEIERARRAYPTAHLTLGLLYADAGLLKESEQELRLLQKANPDSEIARSLVRQVQELRRRRE